MKLKNVLVCSMVTLLGIAIVIFIVLSTRKDADTTLPDGAGALVKVMPKDEDFTWQAVPDEDEHAVGPATVPDPETSTIDPETSSTFVKALDEMPDEILATKGYRDFMESEYNVGDQQWSYVEEGNLCKVYVLGEYRVVIEWIRGAGDCTVFVLSMQDASKQLAFFGRDM